MVNVSRVRRPGRRARWAVALLVAMTLGGAALIVAPRILGQRGATEQQANGSWQALERCEGAPARELCAAITDGVSTWRYALLRGKGASPETVLVDLGGPGQAILSGSENLGAFAADFGMLARYNLLFVEEPWVTQEIPDGCDVALAAHLRRLRARIENAGATDASVARKCQLSWRPGLQPRQPVASRDWGFDPAVYADLIVAICRLNNLRLTGFIGHSWGSARLAYLLERAVGTPGWSGLRWSILVRPFPVGVGADQLIAERTRALQRDFGSVHPMPSTTSPARSLPVTLFDQLSAVVELGYVDSNYVNAHASAVLRGTGVAQIGQLSDELWRRFGRESLSPAKLAQWQEICSTAVGSSPSHTGRIRTVSDLLAAEYSACDGIPTHRDVQAATGGTTCIVTAETDSVTPVALIRQVYQRASPDATWVKSPDRQHGSFDGLGTCLNRVLP